MSRFIIALASLSFAVACVDNSGGVPPAGERVEHETVFLDGGGIFCQIFDDEAFLLTADTDVDAFKVACTELDATKEARLRELVDELTGDEALVIIIIGLGGCIHEAAVMGVYIDDTVAHAHVLKGDTSYGVANAACTDDIGEAVEILRIDEKRTATDADVHVGIYNPDLPGAPALPGN